MSSKRLPGDLQTFEVSETSALAGYVSITGKGNLPAYSESINPCYTRELLQPNKSVTKEYCNKKRGFA